MPQVNLDQLRVLFLDGIYCQYNPKQLTAWSCSKPQRVGWYDVKENNTVLSSQELELGRSYWNGAFWSKVIPCTELWKLKTNDILILVKNQPWVFKSKKHKKDGNVLPHEYFFHRGLKTDNTTTTNLYSELKIKKLVLMQTLSCLKN